MIQYIFLLWNAALAAAAGTAWFDKGAGILALEESNYDKVTSRTNRNTLVFFVKSPISSKRAQTLAKSVESSKGLATFAVVECSQSTALCEDDHTKDMIKVFKQGEGPTSYDGLDDAKSINTFVKSLLPLDTITQVKAKNKKKFLSKKGKKGNLPKTILFSKSKDSSPLLQALALQLKGRMKFGQVHSSERKLVRLFGVEKFPMLVVVPSGGTEDDRLLFTGKMNHGSLSSFLRQHALEGDDEEDVDYAEELTDDSCLDAICGQGLCVLLVVSFDEQYSDKRVHRQALDKFTQVESLDSLGAFQFAWINGLKHMNFLAALDLEPKDYPQVVLLSRKKQRAVNFIGQFEPESIYNFLSSVRSGRTSTVPIGELPSVGEGERCKDMKIPQKIQSENKAEEKKKSVVSRGFRGGKGVVKLNAENWDSYIGESRSTWMVAFTAKKDQDFSQEWEATSLKLKNFVRFAQVDCTEVANEDLASSLGIDSFPAIKYWSFGSPKTADGSEDYESEVESSALDTFARSLLDKGDNLVSSIDGAVFGPWMQSNPMQPRVVFFSDKKSTPDLVKAVAMEYEGELLFAISKSDPDLQKQFGVQKVPAVLLLQGQIGKPNAQGQAEIKVQSQVIPSKIFKNFNNLAAQLDQVAIQWSNIKQQLEQQGVSVENMMNSQNDDVSERKDEL